MLGDTELGLHLQVFTVPESWPQELIVLKEFMKPHRGFWGTLVILQPWPRPGSAHSSRPRTCWQELTAFQACPSLREPSALKPWTHPEG